MTASNIEPDRRIDGARHESRDLSEEECWGFLRSQSTGRFGFLQEDRVMILPVNYLVYQQAIFFRTSADGIIGDSVPYRSASFQVDGSRQDLSEGWSVLASGPSSRVEDPELVTYLWGRVMPEPWAGGERNLFIRIDPENVTGRMVYLA